MQRSASCALAVAMIAASALGCGGRMAGVSASVGGETSTLGSLEEGASVRRAYVGTTNEFVVGEVPVVATFDLVGGAQIEMEVVTRDASPVRFELWQAHRDGTTTLRDPVDAPSGFAIDRVEADEDGRWALVFPVGTSGGRALVRMDCVGGFRGCAPQRQPGESCPAGWSCDVGLECMLPVGACGPLAASGTCTVPPVACAGGGVAVCGCDGRTYASECDARLAHAPILRAGRCDR
jgi:hypothetical protein